MNDEYIFTFGQGQPLAGHCVRIRGDYAEAREKMIEKFGLKWAFQYDAKQWDEWKDNPERAWYMEKEIPFELATAEVL